VLAEQKNAQVFLKRVIEMRINRIKLKNILVLLISTLLSLLIIEAVLRIYNFPVSPSTGWRWEASPYKSEANRNDNKVNQLGIRGRPIAYGEADTVVLLVGDSYVEAGAQPFEDMPEQILEKAFASRGFGKVKVFSIAAAGWGQDQEIFWLQRYFQSFRADLVINFFTPVNDYWENTFVDRSVDPHAGPLKPTYRLQSDGSLSLVKNPVSSLKTWELLRFGVAKALRGKATTLNDLYADEWDAQLPPGDLTPTSAAECPTTEVDQTGIMKASRNGVKEITVVTPERVSEGRTHFSPFITPLSPRETYEINLTHALMGVMRDIAVAHKAEFRILYPRGSEIDRAVGRIRCVRSGDKFYRTDMRDMLQFVLSSAIKGAVIPVTTSDFRRTNLVEDDWHLDRLGNEETSLRLVDALAQQGLLPNVAQQAK
jgi:hypothetical protein